MRLETDGTKADDIRKYLETIQGEVVAIAPFKNVKIIKGDLKERKEKFTLILRYKLL